LVLQHRGGGAYRNKALQFLERLLQPAPQAGTDVEPANLKLDSHAPQIRVGFFFGSTVRRTCRRRNAALRRTDCTVIFFFAVEDGFLEGSGKIARAERSQRLAQANSIASTASPSGITLNAGPGSTRRATPIASTVPPTTVTTIRLKCSIAISFVYAPMTERRRHGVRNRVALVTHRAKTSITRRPMTEVKVSGSSLA